MTSTNLKRTTSDGGDRRCVLCSSGRCHFCRADTGVEVCALDMLVGVVRVAACPQCRGEPPWLDLCETADLVDAHPPISGGEPDDSTPAEQVEHDPVARVRTVQDADRRRRREAVQAEYRLRLVEAAGIDPGWLSEQGRRILGWLCTWDEPTVEGLMDILGATRTAAQVAVHRGEIDRKPAALRDAEASTGAAMACVDAGDAHVPPSERQCCLGHGAALAGAWGRASLRASYATALLRMVVEARDDSTGVLPLSCVLPIENYLEREAQRGPDLDALPAGGGDGR